MLLTIDYSFSFSEIIAPILGVLVTITIFIIGIQREKIKEIKNQLSDKKFRLYNEVLSLLFDILKDSKKKDPDILANEIGQRIYDVKKELLLYAPDEVLHKFIEWSNYANDSEKARKHILIFIDLMKLIRQDMGHPKTDFQQDDFWKLIMKTDEDIRLMKESLR